MKEFMIETLVVGLLCAWGAGFYLPFVFFWTAPFICTLVLVLTIAVTWVILPRYRRRA